MFNQTQITLAMLSRDDDVINLAMLYFNLIQSI